MTAVLIFLIVVLIFTAIGAGGAASQARDHQRRAEAAEAKAAELTAAGYEHLVGRRVVVHLQDRSLRGVYARAWVDGHTLAHPEWLQGAQPAELGGEMFLPLGEVSMIQVFDAADES